MKIASVADVHLGNHRRFGGVVEAGINRRCRAVLDVLAQAVEYAVEQGADEFHVLGDLFDTARPEPQLIASVMQIFDRWSERIRFRLLVGNHDQVSMTPGDHALAPLFPTADVIETPRIIRLDGSTELICMPFRPGNASEWFGPALDALMASQGGAGRAQPPARLLTLHLGIKHKDTPPWLMNAADAIDLEELTRLCERHYIAAAFAGNWHDRKHWKGSGQPGALPRILQVGALVPTGFDNPGLGGFGTVAFWDSVTLKVTTTELGGPRFIKVQETGTLDSYVQTAREEGLRLFVDLVSVPEELNTVGSRLAAMVSEGLIAGGEAHVDEDAVRSQAQQAATAARGAADLAQALSTYVAEMPLADGVVRPAVERLAAGYLAKSPAESAGTTGCNVEELRLLDFILKARVDLKLTPGITLVTGTNGAGKSRLIEAVAVAGWGRTLRGPSPWREGWATEVMMRTDALTVTRKRSKGGTNSLEWSLHGELPTKYETPSKAQEALEDALGSFEVWRRTRVFSSADPENFSKATDAARKRFIEAMIGCDRFDPAAEACRLDLAKAMKGRDAVARTIDTLEAELRGESRRLVDAQASLASHGPAPALPAPLAAEQASDGGSLAELELELRRARTRLSTAERAGGEHEALAKHLQGMLDRLNEGASCPTCGQDVTDELLGSLQLQAQQASTAALEARDNAQETRRTERARIAELEADVRAVTAVQAQAQAELRTYRAAKAAHEQHDATRRRLEATLKAVKHKLVELEESLDSARGDLVDADARIAELKAAEHVLGVKGVRGVLLGRSLAGLESVCNAWLARLGYDALSIELRPYSELKKGGTSESISLTVKHAEWTKVYDACSQGERRRVDAALLLAFAEVSSAAAGSPPGTMWFDEVFDGLDEAGTDAVIHALRDLAADRPVVVITHSRDLAERFSAMGVRRVRVANGMLTE